LSYTDTSSKRSLNATSTGYQGFNQEMSFARLVLSTASLEDIPPSSNIAFPVRESAADLVQECVKNVFSVYPVLSETATYGSLEAAYRHAGQFCSSLDLWNVRLVIAIGLLCRSTSKDDMHYQSAVRHLSAALEHREAVLQPGSAEAIQAILLLVLYSLLDPAHFSVWYLVSVASRIWVDIGLHQEPVHLRRKSTTAQYHRRLFYCIYSLDRLVQKFGNNSTNTA
jgi:hypothetical protein